MIDEGGELMMFEDVHCARRYLEPQDVDAGLYRRSFDASGRYLEIGTVGGGDVNPVTIRIAEGRPTGRDDLRKALAASLPGARPEDDLEELVERATRELRYY